MHKDSKYVLFLDDDVRLHPGSIGSLTLEMEKNPEVWLKNMKTPHSRSQHILVIIGSGPLGLHPMTINVLRIRECVREI